VTPSQHIQSSGIVSAPPGQRQWAHHGSNDMRHQCTISATQFHQTGSSLDRQRHGVDAGRNLNHCDVTHDNHHHPAASLHGEPSWNSQNGHIWSAQDTLKSVAGLTEHLGI